jgi:hypothetical protein
MNFIKSRVGAVATAITAAVVSGQVAAQQDSVLPADFSGTMDGVSADITTVGGALIGLAVVAVGIKWVKATFFG